MSGGIIKKGCKAGAEKDSERALVFWRFDVVYRKTAMSVFAYACLDVELCVNF
jgi:hypothetical protein